MDTIDVRIGSENLAPILNAADKAGRPYKFKRLPDDVVQRQSNGPAPVVLVLEGGDWVGPTPTITLRENGMWTCSLDVYFGG